ncbi:MAG: CHAT domain-containing protein [Acidobacteriota bacterium]
MKYQNFVLSFSRDNDGNWVVEASSPTGESKSQPFRPDPAFTRIYRGVRPAGEPNPSPEEHGEHLYRALFDGELGKLFENNFGAVEASADRGLRLLLKFDPRHRELMSLPWELLFRQRTGNFLGLSRKTPIVRALDVPSRSIAPKHPERLKVLAVRGRGGGPSLDLDREVEQLTQGIEKVAEIRELTPESRSRLRRTLLEDAYHVLHIMAHSEVDPRSHEGRLFLGMADQSDLSITGQELALEVRDASSLQLIFLNSCESARGGAMAQRSDFSGIASALLRTGFPAVVAMNQPISDAAAIAFSSEFYRRLALGDSLEEATNEGRLAIHRLDGGSTEWSTPVLFSGPETIRLVAPQSSSPRRSSRFRKSLLGATAFTLMAALVAFVPWRSDRRALPTESTEPPIGKAEAAHPVLMLDEIFYDAVKDDDGFEYIVLYNSGPVDIDLGGYSLGAGGEHYNHTTIQLEGIIGAGQIFVVGGPESNERNGFPEFDQRVNIQPDLQNVTSEAADGVALFDRPKAQIKQETVPIDAVIYGEKNTNRLIDRHGDVAKPHVGMAPKGHCLERVDLAGNWRISSQPTPNRSNLRDGNRP